MATELITQSVGIFKAGENMQANQFHAVRFNMFERWQLAAGNTAQGIISNTPISGGVANVIVFGVTKAKLGADVLAGRQLTNDINSQFVEGAGPVIAMENGSAGDIISVFISAAGGSTGGGAAVFITNVTSAGNTVVTRNANPNEESVSSITTDDFNMTVEVEWDRDSTEYEGSPTVNGFPVTWVSRVGDTNYGTAVISGVVTEIVASFNGSNYIVPVDADPGPVIQSATFDLIYPITFGQTQTQLKTGDQMGVDIVTDILTESVEFEFSGGLQNTTDTSMSGTSFKATSTAASVGSVDTSSQALSGRVRATSATGSVGPWFDITNTADFNDWFPPVTIGAYTNTSNPGFTAFKNVEAGEVINSASDFDEILYSDPHGDFIISNTTTLESPKVITCTNPGDYNDSSPNFQIRARRYANGSETTDNTIIEVADIAPLITVTQPVARMQSNIPFQDYVITATSNQNIRNSAPLLQLTIPVGGTFQGADWVTGDTKVFTRTIRIVDGDVGGTGAWSFFVIPTNNAGLLAAITGDEVIGGFFPRVLTLAAFANETDLNINITDYSKLTISWAFKPAVTSQAAVGTTVPPPQPNFWCADSLTSPNVIRILDTAATDSSSQASLITVEESI